MKQVFEYSLYLLALVALVTLSTCSSPSKDEGVWEAPVTKEATEEVMDYEEYEEPATLSEQQEPEPIEEFSSSELHALEVRAIQKLNDFADLLTIISDHTYEEAFRKHAITQCFSLLDNEDIRIPKTATGKGSNESISIKSFLKQIYFNKASSLQFEFSNIEVVSPLQPKGDSLYSGVLSFHQSIVGMANLDTTFIHSSKYTVDIIHRRELKYFGENKVIVWEVKLGDFK